ncbi:hypothetical protein QLQ12_14110 [Actinoplanes sp. NEAU-A12]|uniref:Secreted protein n=1 Tax=Actinoplanes sandaracinus TaxID=3045177 RepID=A0ABT6WJ28_9ACTN|nr:hypothetical protein [Actinoplanes sandaracinus]MDI6099734.1 hypothetical protein [Actinoplanes sandaracinus]
MTNWMTAAGLAFIAGGLATLISFRAVLFGGGARRANRAGSSARRRRSDTGVRSTPGPRATVDAVAVAGGEPTAPRRRKLAAAFSGRPVQGEGGPSGLASIGLADEDDGDLRRNGFDDYDPGEDEIVAEVGTAYDDEDRGGYEDGYLEDGSWPPRRRRREPEPDGVAWARRDIESPGGYAGRYSTLDSDKLVPDWDWPRYSDVDDRPPSGDYWTPVPDDLYNPPELDPLPPVPDYEPATGFDLAPVPAEPVGPAPEWPPREGRRVRLPRSWSERDVQSDHEEQDAGTRPSPRPRPAPYISKHSAGPH